MKRVRVLVIGGGFAGVCVGARLLGEGITDFVVLEKAAQLGGTWRDNTYPGCACDVPSQLYSFSFAPNPDWGRVFAEQPEIQAYLLRVARDHGVEPYVRFGQEVEAAEWNEGEQRWTVTTADSVYSAQVLVAGTGPLHAPRIPDLPGLQAFEGTSFHSARWNHRYELAGKSVVVVGTGSSAIQFVPRIQPQVAQLTLFQRTAPWVLPKPDHTIPALEKAVFRYVPGARLGFRGLLYGTLELLQLAQRKPEVMRQLQKIGLLHLRRQVRDPALRAQLTPSFVLGCKRLLLSNTYYPALQKDNVQIVASGVERVTPTGVVGADGVEHAADAIVFATGFHATDPPIAEVVRGRTGETLAAAWAGSPRAYLGTTVAGFPNLFLTLGPNLGNGHSSALFLIESQVRYVISALRTLERCGLQSVEVRRGVQATYNEEVQSALEGTVWNAGGCASWYIDRNGRNSTIYPWTTLDLQRRLWRFDVAAYETRHAEPAPSTGVRGRLTRLLKRSARAQPAAIPLAGAVVAITGGARGIGLATGRALVARGARVFLGDLDLDAARAAAAALGPRAQALALDVTRRSSWQRFLEAIEAHAGPVDVLINNAGVMPTGGFLDESDATYRATLDVNLRGPALGMKLVLPGMIERGRGHVANVSSMAGKIPVAGLATYCGSKHALVGLSRSVREELEGTGVSLGVVLPGFVRTRLSAGISRRGTFSVEPEAVARAIVESLGTRDAERVVPRPLSIYTPLAWALPERVMGAVRRLVRSKRVLQKDVAVRSDYETSIEAQGAREPVGAR